MSYDRYIWAVVQANGLETFGVPIGGGGWLARVKRNVVCV